MGNVDCTPQDCINMRPGQVATDCFKSDGQGQRRHVSRGTPRELYEEWTKLNQLVSDAFADDPLGNTLVLKISQPMLT